MCDDCERRAEAFGEEARRQWLEARGVVILVAVVPNDPDDDSKGHSLTLSSSGTQEAMMDILRAAVDPASEGEFMQARTNGEACID